VTDETKQTLVELGLRVAERFGVPVVILAAMMLLAREAATTAHTTVILPIIKSHTEFLEATRTTLTEIGKTQQQQAVTLQEIAVGQREIQSAIHEEHRK
jgi:hypothetical protein